MNIMWGSGSMHKRSLENIDRLIIQATQGGLPVSSQPYHEVARATGLPAEIVMERFRDMQGRGVIRRIGLVPNHYHLGYRANGMSVWDVPDERIDELGKVVGALDFVSHCYHRPRHMPVWPYNLFAMVHGKDRDTTDRYVKKIAEILGDAVRGHDVLYSTRILKKTGLRI